VDTGSLYTIVEPTFLTALGMDLARAIDHVEIVGIGGQLRVPRLTVERCHCFGQTLSAVPQMRGQLHTGLTSVSYGHTLGNSTLARYG